MSDFDWINYPPFEPSIPIRDFVIETLRLQHDALEEMAERMITSPLQCGIAVIINEIINLDDLEASLTRHYRLDEHVPYGHVWEFPSMDAYQTWIERGWPQR